MQVLAFVKISDMNGRIIKTLAATAKGNGQIMLQADGLPSGYLSIHAYSRW
jgi:hypothetical protein